MTRLILGVLALACVCLNLSPALADVAVQATHPTVDLPWGDWITAVLQPVSAVLVPIAAAAVTAGVAKVAPAARLVLSDQRVQAAIQRGVDAGINRVAGAVKGKTLSVHVGSAVVAEGAQHVIDHAPAAVVKMAGGPQGIASAIFRSLPLDEHADVATVLKPALADLKRKGLIKA